MIGLKLDLLNCRIVNARGNYEIYDIYGSFVTSGNTEQGAIDNLKAMIIEQVQRECIDEYVY